MTLLYLLLVTLAGFVRPQAQDEVLVYESGDTKRIIFWIVLGILLFLLVWYPLYGAPLRYQLGGLFDKILTIIGGFLMFFGVLAMVFGFLSLFTRRFTAGIKLLVLGSLMIWAAMWLGIPMPEGSPLDDKSQSIPRGYT